MKAFTKILAGGVGLAALASAAPAAAQYYPSPYGYGYGQTGGLGAIIESLLGGNRYVNGVDQRALVERCIASVNTRMQQQYAGYGAPYGSPYGSPYGYGYSNASSARVLGITRVDRRSNGVRVRGTATANAYAAAPYGGAPYGAPYGYGYGQPQPVGELTFKCDVDYRGYVRDIDLNRNRNVAYYPYRR